MQYGTIKWFNGRERPFGFIKREGGGVIYFHYDDCMLLAADGQSFTSDRDFSYTPQVGGRVCFEVLKKNGKSKARPWAVLPT